MEFFNKYKTYIIAGVCGAVIAILLSYLIDIPMWLTGAIIAMSSGVVTDWATKMFDEQSANFEKKRAERKATNKEAK